MTTLYIKTYIRDNEPSSWIAMWDSNYLFFIHHGHAMIGSKTCLEPLSKTKEGVGNGELKWHRGRWKWSCTTSQERWSHMHCHNNGCHCHCHNCTKTLPKTTFMTPWILLLELQPLILQYKIFIPSFSNSHNNHTQKKTKPYIT